MDRLGYIEINILNELLYIVLKEFFIRILN